MTTNQSELPHDSSAPSIEDRTRRLYGHLLVLCAALQHLEVQDNDFQPSAISLHGERGASNLAMGIDQLLSDALREARLLSMLPASICLQHLPDDWTNQPDEPDDGSDASSPPDHAPAAIEAACNSQGRETRGARYTARLRERPDLPPDRVALFVVDEDRKPVLRG